MTLRRLPLAVGVLALAAGVGLAIGVVPSPSVVLATGAFVVTVLVGAVVAGAALVDRATEGPRSEPLPDPGGGADADVPGDEVDRLLASIASDEATHGADLAERIEGVAVSTVARETDCSPETARERLAAGTWTDDERAAAFFATAAPAPSVRDRLRAVVRGESTRQRRAARAIDALYRLTEDE